MKAAIVRGPGQTPVYADFPQPAPSEGENRIRATAAALSPLVRGRASGAHYSASNAFPFVVGVDGVGRLDDGRPVYFILPRAPYGAMAQETVAPSAHCLPLPDGLDDVTASGHRQSRHVVLGGVQGARQAQGGRERSHQWSDRRRWPPRRSDRQTSWSQNYRRDWPKRQGSPIGRGDGGRHDNSAHRE